MASIIDIKRRKASVESTGQIHKSDETCIHGKVTESQAACR